MSWAKLTSITAYRHEQITSTFDITLTPACCLQIPVPFPPFALTIRLPVVNIVAKDQQFSQELQLLSPDNSRFNWLTWVTGLYYFHDNEEQASSFSAVKTDSYSGSVRHISSFSLLPVWCWVCATRTRRGHCQ